MLKLMTVAILVRHYLRFIIHICMVAKCYFKVVFPSCRDAQYQHIGNHA